MYNLLLLSILRSCGISSEMCYLTDDYWIFLSTGLQRNAALWLYHQAKKLQQPASVLQTGVWAPSLNLQSVLEREKRQNISLNIITEKPLSPSQVTGSVFQSLKCPMWATHFPVNSGQHPQAGCLKPLALKEAPSAAHLSPTTMLLLPIATEAQAAVPEWNPFCSYSLANALTSKARISPPQRTEDKSAHVPAEC